MPLTFDERIGIVREFLDAIGDLDFPLVERHLAADAVMVLPFVEDVPAVQGRSAIAQQLRTSVPAMFERMNFTYDQFYDVKGEGEGTGALVAEYHSECPQVGTGKLYRNTYITVFGFEGGKIALYKEYLNPLKFIGFTDAAAEV
ncbi:nuclear transport factor 2 family protein [Mycobacterium sp. OTB74]|uniref:nuclear transport factor 2 family protein n=1 Tax=Mycobacterium sp. OTB74 TaxID=1853452 RepID=UPI0024743A5D|nr:nuclear transport factor 2 family protein [Mycobacterium sp. OTB74]MDH6242725.1 ketosteroid isomerase-like protein [Mycobacterium sp. OTB74]